jgi:hypothetical protein
MSASASYLEDEIAEAIHAGQLDRAQHDGGVRAHDDRRASDTVAGAQRFRPEEGGGDRPAREVHEARLQESWGGILIF